MEMEGKIKIKLIGSVDLHAGEAQGDCAESGLKKINQVVERPDTPAFRGFVKKIPHLLALVD